MTPEPDGLAARVRRLEDRSEIQEVRYTYCYAIDEGDWETLVEQFTRDATLDYGGLGRYNGREGVREFASEFVESSLQATAHAVHNPMLEVDGDTASGQWYVTSAITDADGTGGFRWGQYEEAYRRVDGDWLIDDLRLRFVYSLDYGEDGWPDLEVHPLR